MKPVLFLDIDGVLNGYTGEASDLHPEWPEAFCRVLGASGFFRWVREHFDVVWLTSWMLGGGTMRERPRRVASLAWLLGVEPEEFLDLPAAPWWGSKTEGIERALGGSAREWAWLDDEEVEDEQAWLRRTQNQSRFFRVNCYEDVGALEAVIPRLASRFGLPLPPEERRRGMGESPSSQPSGR